LKPTTDSAHLTPPLASSCFYAALVACGTFEAQADAFASGDFSPLR